jgi:hypothetical protein
MILSIMNIDFIIIGTAKSKVNKQYYINERWKVWGLLFYTKKIKRYWKNIDDFNENATQDFAQTNGFQFVDLLDRVFNNDSSIDLNDPISIDELKKNIILIKESSVSNLIFNGKTAFTFFLLGNLLLKGKDAKIKELKKMVKKYNYGKLDKNNFIEYVIDSFEDKNVFLAPNTSSMSSSFDEFVWIDVLRNIKKNKNYEY